MFPVVRRADREAPRRASDSGCQCRHACRNGSSCSRTQQREVPGASTLRPHLRQSITPPKGAWRAGGPACATGLSELPVSHHRTSRLHRSRMAGPCHLSKSRRVRRASLGFESIPVTSTGHPYRSYRDARRWRLTAPTTARSDAVRMLGFIPTPQSTTPPDICDSTNATAVASEPLVTACSL